MRGTIARRVVRAVTEARSRRGALAKDANGSPFVQAGAGNFAVKGLKSAAENAFPGVRNFRGSAAATALASREAALAAKASLAVAGGAAGLYALASIAGCFSAHVHARRELLEQTSAYDKDSVAAAVEADSAACGEAALSPQAPSCATDGDNVGAASEPLSEPAPPGPGPEQVAAPPASTAADKPAQPAAPVPAEAPPVAVAQSAAEPTDADLLGDDGRKLLFQLAAQHWVSLLFTAAFTFASTLLKLAATRKMGKLCVGSSTSTA